MKRERQSNFELLRILLMIAIPVYHLMLYSGMNTMPYSNLTITSFLLSSGSAIVADYAFMAMSSYFFIEGGSRLILPKFVRTVVQVVFIYGIKIFTLDHLLHYSKDYPFIGDFFYEGSWWFIYVYLFMLCIHPLLNKVIAKLAKIQILCVCILLGLIVTYNGFAYVDNLFYDTIAFLFTYFVISYLKHSDYKCFFGMKNKKSTMLIIYILGVIVTFAACVVVKLQIGEIDVDLTTQIVRRLIGKYAITQFVMGIAIFLLFKEIKIGTNKWINAFSRNVFYVFLLHETVMAVFWSRNKLVIIENQLPYDGPMEMILGCIVYLGATFIFAMIVRWIYEHTLRRIVDYFINKYVSVKEKRL